MEGKKISFGFMKTKKVDKPVVEEKKEFIECVEEKSIKIVGGEPVKDDTPLVIPMKPNTLVTAERLKQIAEKVEGELEETEQPKENNSAEEKVPENETLEQMAIRELMQDAKKEIKVENADLTVPLPAKPIVAGEKESSLDDYEAMPIQEFGKAMLRGMGWTPNKDQSKYKQPQLRPKGLGLGADKVVSENQKNKISKDKNDVELTIVKNAYVKITNGKWSGCYGKVLSLDEDNGRVMVDIPIKKETVSLSEFMMHPVTKAEFDKESKVINADTFEEYKKGEKSSQQSSRNVETHANNKHRDDKRSENDVRKHRDYEQSSNGRSTYKERQRRNSSSSEEKYVQKKSKDKRQKKRYSSNESLSSSEDDKRRKKRESRKRRSSSLDSSDSYKKSKRHATPDGKRDIDKKRKGKKKKRDRDRSPNYKKHRK